MPLIPSDLLKKLRHRRTLAILGASILVLFTLLLWTAFQPLFGGYTPAGILLSMGDKSHPRFVEALCRFGRQAFSLFGRNNPLKIKAQYALGRNLYRQRRYLESINYLSELSNSKGDAALNIQTRLDLRYYLASDYWYTKDYSMSAQRFAEAAELATQVSNREDYKIEVAKWRIKALLRSAQWDQADAAAAQTKLLFSESSSKSRKLEAELNVLMNDILVSESRFDELQENLEKQPECAEADSLPTKPSINKERRLGWLSFRLGHYDEALQHFNTVLKHSPDDGYSIWRRGMCYDLQNKPELAIADYTKYLTTDDYRKAPDNSRMREVVDFKKHCANDYFAAEAGRAHWGVWSGQVMPIKVYVSEGSVHGFNALTRKEIIKCLDRWCPVVPESLKYILVDSQDKAQLVFVRVDSGYDLTDQGNYDGMTYINSDQNAGWGPYQINRARIELADIDMRTVSTEKVAKVHSLLLHEIGHALGLRTHSPNAGDIMFQSTIQADLSARDIATIKLIYAPDASKKAKALVDSLAQSGSAYAQYTRGLYLQDKEKDFERAKEQFKKAYDHHLAEAATAIGSMYMSGGPNFPQNYERSLQWFEKAVMRGDNYANVRIGELYQFGYGVHKSPERAVAYYQKAADEGNSFAQRKLGIAYNDGSGVDKDYFQAFQWFKKAALRNDGYAQQRLAYAYHLGLGTEKNDYEAFTWYKAAAANQIAVAKSWLGFFYEHGLTVPVDKSKAQYWYREAAADGDRWAVSALKKLDDSR